MSYVATRKWAPGSDAYEGLNAFQKVDVLVDLIAAERTKRSEKDPFLLAELKTEEAYWRRRATLMDPFWDATHNLFVAREDGVRCPYIPRPAQEQLNERVEKAQAEQRPLYLLVPKPRKAGWSEGSVKVLYPRFRTMANHSILVMAQKGPEGEKIFKKFRYTWEHDLLRPELKHNNVRMLETKHGGSVIDMRTAGAALQEKQGTGRGDTVHDFFGTEVAFWPDTAIHLMTGVLNSMPRYPFWDTIRILESTGFGRVGYMWDRCQEAIEHPESTLWELLLMPWLELHDCYIPLQPGEQKRLRDEIFGRGGNPEERFLIEERGATYEQIKFRRERIKAQGGSPKEQLRAFRQEYPLDLDDAFQAHGTTVFDPDQVTMQSRRSGPPKWKGDLVSPHQLWARRRAVGVVRDTPNPSFTGEKDWDESGKLEVWRKPGNRHRYLIGVDPSHGTAYGDPSVIVIMDRDTGKQVAVWSGEADQEDLVEPVRLLSKWYNDAEIIVERNLGRLLIKWLMLCDRKPFLYRTRDESMVKQNAAPEERYGHDTEGVSKPVLVGLLREALNRNPEFFQDPATLREMKDFQQTLNARGTAIIYPGAKPGAGRHDDRLIASGLCLVAHMTRAMLGPAPQEEGNRKPTAADRWDMDHRHTKKKPVGKRHPELGLNY